MKYYYSPGACSLAGHIVIEEEGLAADFVKVDLRTHRTASGEDFTAINPKGYVPTIGLDEGGILTENVAILQYLGDRKPEKGMVPPPASSERYRLQEWLAYITSELHKSFAPLFHGSASPDDKARAEAQIRRRLAFIDEQVGPEHFLLGGDFSVADAYLFVMLHWCTVLRIDLSDLANLMAYKARIESRPSVQAALKAEGLKA